MKSSLPLASADDNDIVVKVVVVCIDHRQQLLLAGKLHGVIVSAYMLPVDEHIGHSTLASLLEQRSLDVSSVCW